MILLRQDIFLKPFSAVIVFQSLINIARREEVADVVVAKVAALTRKNVFVRLRPLSTPCVSNFA